MRTETRGRGGWLGVAVIALALVALPAAQIWAEDSIPRLPGAARAILHFDLTRLRQSDIYRTAEENIGVLTRSNEKLQMFLNATGLSEAAGALESFTLYSFADVENPQEFAGVVSGGFTPETMQRLEKAYAPVARKVNGQVIMPVIQTPEMELVMSFLGPGLLSFGTAASVEAVARTTENAPSLQAAFKRTETRRPVWGLIDARQILESVTAAGALGGSEAQNPLSMIRKSPALTSLKALGFSVDLGSDIFFEMRAFTDDPESARMLADAVKGMVALGQMGAGQASDPDILEFFRRVVAESERDSLYVSFALTASQIQKLKSGHDLFSGIIPE